jgi:hypothetical protein
MGALRSNAKFLCIFMAGLTMMVSLPCQSGIAALINTETVLNSVPGDEARNQLRQFLSRADVRTVLMAHNIDPREAKKRIDMLTDDEVIRISQRIDQLPAGGGAAEVLLILILAVILVFIILDLSGVTDVFTFIKPQK